MTDYSKTTIATFDKLAQVYQEKFMDFDLYNDTYDKFCGLVTKPGAKILEIGCGPGNITRYLLSRRPQFKIIATDAAPAMVKLAAANNPAAECRVMDAANVRQLGQQFDAVVCGFCMPYLSKEACDTLIGDCSALLEPGGIFYFSTIEGEATQSGIQTNSHGDTTYVYYHQEYDLYNKLEENHFVLLELVRKHYTSGTDATHLVFIARKK